MSVRDYHPYSGKCSRHLHVKRMILGIRMGWNRMGCRIVHHMNIRCYRPDRSNSSRSLQLDNMFLGIRMGWNRMGSLKRSIQGF